MISPRIPEAVQPILEDYVSQTDRQLPGLLSGFYIVGSIALDGFNERFSDIDFIATLSRWATLEDFQVLTGIHKTIGRDFPRWQLAGPYLQTDDLGRFENEKEPHPYYQDGRLHQAGYFEINSVSWWVLKHAGIAILGREPAELPFSVNWDRLIADMKRNLNSYWASWARNPARILVMLSDWGIQWAVLGVLREYHTFRENAITTKVKAAEYALTCLPGRWHPLIQEAIDIREGRKDSHFRSRMARMVEAVRFLRFVIQTANHEFP